MIKERYVSFEIAKLLKKKGFDEPCRLFYKNPQAGLYEFKNAPKAYKDNPNNPCFLAPTLYMTMEWLREKYKLFLGVGFGNDDKGEFLYMVDIYDLTIEAIKGKYQPIVEADEYLEINPKTPEEAVEAAILYSLENLI